MFKVIWQYDEKRMGRINSETVPLVPLPNNLHDPLFEGIPILGRPEPVFRRPPLKLRSKLMTMSENFREDPINDLASYQHAFVSDYKNALLLKDRLSNEPDVRYVDIQGRLEQPFILEEDRRRRVFKNDVISERLSLSPSSTQNLQMKQGYLNPAPTGINANYAWNLPGGLGDGVTIIDIENGWNFDHEDLIDKQIGVISGINQICDHGTAVLGIYSGDDNNTGVKGIVPNALAGVASTIYDWAEKKWNAADVIYTAVNRLHPGDVILLEMHAPGPNSTDATDEEQKGYIAVEYWQPEFAAINYAVSHGINIVEAAGNGGEDLDNAVYQGRFNRGLRDSGAILVGGGASGLQSNARSRRPWSNYGSRLDVQGWGENIVTTGGRQKPWYHDLVDHEDSSKCYTQSFGGTSGASPIVVGAVAAITACLKGAGKQPLDPLTLREILSHTGTPQSDEENGQVLKYIGPLPDLKSALNSLGL